MGGGSEKRDASSSRSRCSVLASSAAVRGHFSQASFRFAFGARREAKRAASMASVPEPQTGSWPRHGWTVDGELVWGATAAIVRDFVAIVRELAPAQ